ncbi:hypothetical protein MSEN_14390 [Mycolicibacter senuensis]|uniref:Uncharacterized protein n=1 Tax=Mycolicibacter senuensis TaxID=386913 RepID=A0A7I9XIB5_9MYCO|nr:hypothetical protein MSEN_14390 [Mycolicibacter senuensis]
MADVVSRAEAPDVTSAVRSNDGEPVTSGAHPAVTSGARPAAPDRIGTVAASRGVTTTEAHGRHVPPLRNRLRATTIRRFRPGSSPSNWRRRCAGN